MRAVPISHTRPIWAEISAGRLRGNLAALRTAAKPVDVLCVIKADAYGHGAPECAPILAASGAGWLGVTSAEEGIAVRSALSILPQTITPRILVMCGIWPGEEATAFDRQLTPVVWEPYHLDLMEAEARRRNLRPRSIAVHLEIDTGMARQGVPVGPLLDAMLARFNDASPLLLEGVMTHLSSTEAADDPANTSQLARFRDALRQVTAHGLTPSLVHAGNTSSTDSERVPHELPALVVAYNRSAAKPARSMTRIGLALYGYTLPLTGSAPHLSPQLQPVLTWKTRIVSLRDLQTGDRVGYNGTYRAPHPMRLALLPVGYADGLRRELSSTNALRNPDGSTAPSQPGGAVLIHGQRANIVGRVSMDLTLVDITDIPNANIGDEAVIIGSQTGAQGATATIGADEHAILARTSVYEILCGINDRVPRIIID